MKLEHLPEYITISVTAVLGMLLALYVGTATGSGSNTPFLITGCIIALSIALIMREKIWILIPLSWPLIGQIRGLPGAFPMRDVVIIYVFSVLLALKSLKIVRSKTQYCWLDYLLFVNILYLLTVFIRNPVGTESMGLDRVGGKTYFETIFVLCGYWVINQTIITPNLARKVPFFLVAGTVFSTTLDTIANYFPSTIPLIAHINAGASLAAADKANDSLAGDNFMDREQYLAGFGNAILSTLYSLHSPWTTLNPVYCFRFFFSILSMLAILKSGFRSVFFGIALFFILSTYFREGFRSLTCKLAVLIIPLIILIAAQGTVFELPIPMQRTLSFLPGNWNYAATGDATASTEWRHEIWKNVWKSGNLYIDNWWFGDGFGMTKTRLMEARRMADIRGDNKAIQEGLTLTGSYHSLPLSAIHVGGYVGFFLFCVLLFGTTFYSWKLIHRSKGTPYFALALFAGIPTIINPFTALLLTGAFETHLVEIIFSIAILRSTSRSIDHYLTSKDISSTIVTEKALPEFVSNPLLQQNIEKSVQRSLSKSLH